jgi:hypothetical protein
MASLTGFDANQVEPADELEAIPSGKYQAVITESEFKPTKAGNGTYLQLTFEIIDGNHKGRMLWSRLNLDNKSDVAVKIAQQELSAICRAVGVLTPQDSEDLHNLPLVIHVRARRRNDTQEITNEIGGYSAVDQGPRQLATAAPVATAAAARGPIGAGSPAPWKR